MITKLNWPQARQYASINGASVRREAWAPDGETYRWVRRPLVNGRTGSLWYDETRAGVTKTTTGVCIASSMSAADFGAQDWMADYDPANPSPQPPQPPQPPLPQPPQGGELLREDFSSIIKGKDNVVGGAILAWFGNENFPLPTRAYQAGGAVLIGTGVSPGAIESRILDLSRGGGVFAVTFKVKGWAAVEGSIQVSATGLPPKIVSYTATMASGYEGLTVSFTGGRAGSRVKIATTTKRAFIDDVLIVAG